MTQNYSVEQKRPSALPRMLIGGAAGAAAGWGLSKIDALKVAKACKNLGAGRDKKSDSIDYSAGVYLTQKTTEPVMEGETIAIIYTNKEETIKGAEELILDAYTIVEEETQYKSLIYKII